MGQPTLDPKPLIAALLSPKAAKPLRKRPLRNNLPPVSPQGDNRAKLLAPSKDDQHLAKVLQSRNKDMLNEASNYLLILMHGLRKTGKGCTPGQVETRANIFASIVNSAKTVFGWNATTNNTFALNVHMSEDTLDLITEQKTIDKPAQVVDVQSVETPDTPN